MKCFSLWAPSQYQGTPGILLVKLEQLRLGAFEGQGISTGQVLLPCEDSGPLTVSIFHLGRRRYLAFGV